DGTGATQPSGPSEKVGVATGSSGSPTSLRPHASGGNLLGRPVGLRASDSTGRSSTSSGNGGVRDSGRGNFSAPPSGNSGTPVRPGDAGSGVVATASGAEHGPAFGGLGGPARGAGNGPYLNGSARAGPGTADEDGPVLGGGAGPGSGARDEDGP